MFSNVQLLSCRIPSPFFPRNDIKCLFSVFILFNEYDLGIFMVEVDTNDGTMEYIVG